MKTVLVALALALGPSLGAEQLEDIYTRPLRAERSRDVDVLHYRIELALDESTDSFHGKTTISMTSLRDALQRITLDAETFQVQRVEGDSSRELAFEQRDGRLSINLPSPVPYGADVVVTAFYSAVGVDVDSERFGQPASYDLGLDFKEATEDHPRLVNTLSWPEGARHWFPCYDHPNDRATQEVLATVREDYRVLSNGRLLGVTAGDEPGTRVWHWSQERPHPTYLSVLVAGPYAVLDDAFGELPIHYWVYEKDEEDALRSFGKTPRMVDFFNREYGYAYPWVKYDQITIPGIGGGAESTSATVVGESTIHDARAEQDFSSHGLVAHELAHQWWGDLVSYRDWSEAWMSESFATYGEYLFTRSDLGDDEGAVNLLAKKEDYLREARERYLRPIVFRRWNYPNDNFDRHTYQKGAVVLSMLRFVLGDGAFRTSIAHFLDGHAFQSVDTHDFIDAIKESTGQNLEWFFDQWIYRPGHPVLEITREWSAAGRTVSLRVRQVQDTSGHVPVFTAPIDVRIETQRSKATHRIWLSKADETFELEADAAPLLVRFDEGNTLLKEWTFPKSVSELLYQLRNDDVIGRMWAASELGGRTTDALVVAALEGSARTDPFWAVRRAAVEALDSGASAAATETLKAACLDANSRVRVSALRALGNSRDPQLAPFFERRFRADDSYLAQAEAVLGLGKTGERSALSVVEEARTMRSPRDVVARAAREALGELSR